MVFRTGLFLLFAFLTNLLEGQETQVSFPSDTLTLYGTLTVPEGLGPFPAVVLVHGTGASDRDQTTPILGFENSCFYPGIYGDTVRNFRDIALGFQEKGLAVLRYDKRTFTYDGQYDPKQLSPYDYIADVHAALDFLKTRPEVDASCLILLGLSQGTNLIPLVARDRNDVSALMALGAPAQSIDSILAKQIRLVYYLCYKDTLAGDTTYLNILDDFNQIRTNTWDPNTPLYGFYPGFWRDWFRITDSAVYNYNSVSIPTILLQGLFDITVTNENGLRYYTQLTRDSADVYFLKETNHLFTKPDEPFVSEVVIDTLFQWLPVCRPIIGIEREIDPLSGWSIQNSQNMILVRFELPGQFEWLEVIDLSGRLVLKTEASYRNELYIPTNAWPGGMYLIRARSSTVTETRKTIIR